MAYEPSTVFWSLLAGIIPAMLWLWFWLKEDSINPEPRKMIMRAFIGGMLMVPLVVPLQGYAKNHLESALLIIVAWSLIEEFLKYVAAHFTSLSEKDDDEPIDSVMYMITTALGFAALENVLFIIAPLAIGDLYATVVTSNLRFIGATLLHLVCSSAIGISLALAFYKSRATKFLYFLIGLGIATALHSLFNIFIIDATGTSAFIIFLGVWIAVIILALFFEKVKRISSQA